MRGIGIFSTLWTGGCYASPHCDLAEEIEPSLVLGEGESVMEEPDNGIAAVLMEPDGERYIWVAMLAQGLALDPSPSVSVRLFDALDGREVGSREESPRWYGDEVQSTAVGIQVFLAKDWPGDQGHSRMVGEVLDSCGTVLTAKRPIYLDWSF